MKTFITAIALAALATTAYAAMEVADAPDRLCMPAAVQEALS